MQLKSLAQLLYVGAALLLALLICRRIDGAVPTGLPPLISMLSSTTGKRARFFRNLLGSFQRSSHPRRELLVYDDEPGAPSPFWLAAAAADPRVRYFHRPERDGARGYMALFTLRSGWTLRTGESF